MYGRTRIVALAFFLAFGGLSLRPEGVFPAPGNEKKKPAPQAETAPGIIKSQSNLVLVDVVVTDKHSHYLKDLAQKDFHVFEDGVEQPITSFSREADINPDAPQRPRYLALLFDDSGVDLAAQSRERDAAIKFVEDIASPTRMMAVMDFGGFLQIDQSLTANHDLLMSAINKIRFSAVRTSTSGGAPSPMATVIPGRRPSPMGMGGGVSATDQEQTNLAVRELLRAIREAARMLGSAPGRKTLIFLSAGFELTAERQSDFQDTIDALNKANVGLYPVDPAGLTPAIGPGAGASGAGSAGNQVLYALAQKTGGFPVVSTNDLQVGMEKVSAEMNEYYLLGYSPPHADEEHAYHRIRVKVDRTGAEVRARGGYSEVKSPDLLAGKAEGVSLQAKAASLEAGEIPVALSLPYFYVKPGVARVNLALSIPGSAIEFKKHGDGFQSEINILGVASSDDGKVAARFSDTVSLNDTKDEEQSATSLPFNYRNSFKIAPGEYTFKLVLSAGGGKFGKYVFPLIVEPFSGTELTVSGPAFGDSLAPYALDSSEMDQGLTESSAPLVAKGMQLIPSSSNRFQKDKKPVVYLEIYDPLLASTNPAVGLLYEIVDLKTNRKVFSSNTLRVDQFIQPGEPRVPAIFSLPMDHLLPGEYSLKLWARDSSGTISEKQSGSFWIQ